MPLDGAKPLRQMARDVLSKKDVTTQARRAFAPPPVRLGIENAWRPGAHLGLELGHGRAEGNKHRCRRGRSPRRSRCARPVVPTAVHGLPHSPLRTARFVRLML